MSPSCGTATVEEEEEDVAVSSFVDAITAGVGAPSEVRKTGEARWTEEDEDEEGEVECGRMIGGAVAA